MRKLILSAVLVGLLVAPTMSTFAQQAQRETSHWSLGIRVNAPYYRVDPMEYHGQLFRELHWGLGGVLEYTINPLWGFGLMVDYLNINRGGDDRSAQTIDAGLFTSINMLNLLSPNRTRWQRGGLYANFGAGAAFYSNEVGGVENNGISAFGMAGLGVEVALSNSWAIFSDLQYRYYNREDLGGAVSPDMRGNDALVASLGLRFKFNANSREHTRNTRPFTDLDAINELREQLQQLQRQADTTADDVRHLNERVNEDAREQRENNAAQQEEIDELRRMLEELQNQATVSGVMSRIQFNFDSSNLTSAAHVELDRVARELRANDNWGRLTIVGHTCNVGSDDVNNRLSVRRAEAVKAALVERGIPANRIETVGQGASNPIATNATREGRIQNRRVEFQFSR